MNCPKCGKKLETIEVENTVASTTLHLKDDIYIPAYTILDWEDFKCPYCGEYLEDEDTPISKNLVYMCVAAMYKPVLIDLQHVPINVKEIEFQESVAKELGKVMKVGRGKEVKMERKKKEVKKPAKKE